MTTPSSSTPAKATVQQSIIKKPTSTTVSVTSITTVQDIQVNKNKKF